MEEPDLDRCAKFKDFGRGFYLTSSKIQAENFAKISTAKAKNRGLISENERFGFISSFSVTDAAGLNCFYFDTADVAWLHCIVAHRRSSTFVDLRNEMTALSKLRFVKSERVILR